MKITCTLTEFARMVRCCHFAAANQGCTYCALHDLCNDDRTIEDYVTAATIVDEDNNVPTNGGDDNGE